MAFIGIAVLSCAVLTAKTRARFNTQFLWVSEPYRRLLEKECNTSCLLGTMRHLDHGIVPPPCDQPIRGTDPHPVQGCTALERLDLAFRHRYFCKFGCQKPRFGLLDCSRRDYATPGKDRSNIPAPGNFGNSSSNLLGRPTFRHRRHTKKSRYQGSWTSIGQVKQGYAFDESGRFVCSRTTTSKAAGRSGVFGRALWECGKRYEAEDSKYHKG